jgi:hypothetical protein
MKSDLYYIWCDEMNLILYCLCDFFQDVKCQGCFNMWVY